MTALLTVWQRVALAIVVGLSVGTGVLGLRAAGALQSWELWQYDVTSAALATDTPVPDVVLVALTDADLTRWGWPVSDGRVSALAQAALDAGASAVGIDIYRDAPVRDGREELARVLEDPRVVVISKLAGADDAGIAAPEGARTGFADIPIDPDGVARRALLLVNTGDTVALSFPMRLAMIHTGEQNLKPSTDDPRVLALGETPLPPLTEDFGPYRDADAAGYQMLIHYSNELPVVQRVTAQDLLTGNADLRNRVVLIGLTSHSVKDYFLTSLNRRTGADFTFGAELHAAITQQLIDHSNLALQPFTTVSRSVTSALVFAAALAGATLAVFLRMALPATVIALLGTATLAVGLAAAQDRALLLPVVPVALAWVMGFTISFAILASIARQRRRAMASLFTAHMSDALAQEIWSQRKRVLAGRRPLSRRLYVTVLFADIESSSRIGKTMSAAGFMDWISRLLDELGRVAQSHGGFVEKFTGDGVLVIFGAPVPSETSEQRRSDARSAIDCAQAMRRAVERMNAEDTEQPRYGLRIGLHSGEVVAGTLGPTGALRYNVIGDTVNVAARVEAFSKTLPIDRSGAHPICVTFATVDLLQGKDNFSHAGELLHDDGCTRVAVFNLN